MRYSILVTGAEGMIGSALVRRLKCIRDGKVDAGCDLVINDVFEIDRDSTKDQLRDYLAQCNFVFNFAGVNRAECEEEYRRGNVTFLHDLLGELRRLGKKTPVMQASSIHAAMQGRYSGSIYGLTKLEAERELAQYGLSTGAPVAIYRFPNVMGPSRPNYNSAISTFCWAVARDEPIYIDNPATELEVVYVDDLVDEMVALLLGAENHCEYPDDQRELSIPDNCRYCCVPTAYKVSLGEIVGLLKEFRNQRESLVIPEMPAGSFQKKLYSLFLGYLAPEQFKFSLKSNVDSRGSFTELFHTVDCGQISVNITKPGFTKGQHWHESKWEIFVVVAGEALVRERKIDSSEEIAFRVSGSCPEAIYMIPGWTHSITNVSQSDDLVTIMFCNENFNRARPDTYFEEV